MNRKNGKNLPGNNCLGNNCPGGNCSGDFPVDNGPGTFHGGNCPGPVSQGPINCFLAITYGGVF